MERNKTFAQTFPLKFIFAMQLLNVNVYLDGGLYSGEWGGGGVIIGCSFGLKVDGPITGGLVSDSLR